VPLGWDRRHFLVTTGAAATTAVVAGWIAGGIERGRVNSVKASIPESLPPAPLGVDIPAGADVVPGTPYITPAGDFYRIDTALSFPQVNRDKWAMTLDGQVTTPLRLTYADLQARPQVERVITLTCVSNEVGGDLISNAVWQGVLLSDLLAEAGVDHSAEQIFCTSLDEWTCGFPLATALDGRDAMVAIGMNGAPLPLAHGFPARLVVPGLYGYVSAVKWLKSLKVTSWDDGTGYWVPRGWSRLGPIKTESRIDVLRQEGSDVLAAGVAWAQHTGIAKVEVRVDGGPWQETTLAATVSDDTWRQWSTRLQLPKGQHRVQVRATDKTGTPQTEDQADPAPNGATGYHGRRITVP
jgi:DMSO/TMAO reductase YedYZ molybdopterin-dependent catalytic subunit